MALAAFSSEAMINRTLDEIGCNPTNFSEIVNTLSTTRVIAALKGTNDFTAEDAQHYLSVARQLKALSEEYPVPINWRESEKIREILSTRKEYARPVPFYTVYVGPMLFKEVFHGEVRTTTKLEECAAFTDFFIAREAAKLLNGMNQSATAAQYPITNVRRESTIARLADCGFQEQGTLA